MAPPELRNRTNYDLVDVDVDAVAVATPRASGLGVGVVAVALLALLLGACSSPQRASDDEGDAYPAVRPGMEGEDAPVETVYEFEPMVIRAQEDESGEGVTTSAADIPELFREGNDYLRAGDCEEAIELFDLVRTHATDDRYRRAATYNLALCQERNQQLSEAAENYDRVISVWPSSDDAKDAVFRLAEVLAQQGEYQLVEPLINRVLGRNDMTVRDNLEAYLRIGFAKLELRDFAGAQAALSEVLRRNQFARVAWNPEAMSSKSEPLGQNHWIIAQSYYGIGRVYHELFSEIRMVLPLERYSEDLEDKYALLDEAVEAYVEAIKTGNRYWSPAAGFMSGQLHEDYYFDILASEIPAHFGNLEHEIYFEELRKFLEPSLRRAISIYQNNLAMAYRLNSDEVWIDATLERIQVLTEYLEDQVDWEAEHAAVIAGEHPRSARALEFMRFRDEAIESSN